jgi:malate synthase
MKNRQELSEELTKKYKKYLKKRSILIDFKLVEFDHFKELTIDEDYLLKKILSNISQFPTIVPISKRYHLDFIGWNNKEYNDVLLCKNK